ncbi:MAG: sulfite exporter TauE/SafE family protein [Blastocatellia bacterium]|nr:sulfite exporter TauE/SafE family protein [Blastocatellia bacterium]
MTIPEMGLLFAAAVAAGMINSVAGGGTLVTFPALVWAGYSPITANATNTLALVPGAWSGAYGYRRELATLPRRLLALLVPSVAGSLLGAFLLKRTPPGTFAALVPFLVLFATILFMVQEPVQRWLRTSEVTHHSITRNWLIGASFYQFLVAVYGGYFGAGIGILMLAVLGVMGLTDIHQMNGLKNVFGSTINAIAAIYFIFAGLIHWPAALLMAAGATLGGYGAVGIARRIGQKAVRRVVIAIGLGMAVSLFFRGR